MAEDATLAGRGFRIVAGSTTAHAGKEDVTRLVALRDVVAHIASDGLVREMVEAAASEPALGNRGRCDVRGGGGAGDFVAIGASEK